MRPFRVHRMRQAAASARDLVTVSTSAPTGTTASRAIALPAYEAGDTLVVAISTAGTNSLATASAGWSLAGERTSSGSTQPTTLSVFICEGAAASSPLQVTGFPASRHAQAAYVVAGGGTLENSGDKSNIATNSSAAGVSGIDPPRVNPSTPAGDFVFIAAGSAACSAVASAPSGYTLAENHALADNAILTGWRHGSPADGSFEDPSAFGATPTSNRYASATLGILLP